MQRSENLLEEQHDMAIIGMSGLFPQASSMEMFWNHQKDEFPCIRSLSLERQQDIERYLNWIKDGAGSSATYAPQGFLEDIDCFDYPFFHISFQEACVMDPSLRLLLQVAWHALEDAGYGGHKLHGTRTGVFYGESDAPVYSYAQMVADIDLAWAEQAISGNVFSLVPSRIAYLMDWNGPAMVTNASGASSLVAVHQACQSIRAGECEQALIGTARLDLFPKWAHSFDANATASGEGVMAILIKPLGKALQDGDHIHAVIKGSAVNQDGRSCISSTYEDLYARAWKNANVHPSTITYMETQEIEGDPKYSREWNGMKNVMYDPKKGEDCPTVGSIKAKIGNLHHAAGMAGLFQSVMALKTRKLPTSGYGPLESGNLSTKKEDVNLSGREFSIALAKEGVIRCGVSSFGESGTNCHLILESPSSAPSETFDQEWLVLTLSARSKVGLQELICKYSDWLMHNDDFQLNNLCYTANIGRSHFHYRLALVVRSKEDLREQFMQLRSANLEFLDIPRTYYNESTEHTRISQSEREAVSQEYSWSETEARELGWLYTQGAEIDWDQLYAEQSCRKISLPVYPFEKLRCWIDIPSDVSMDNGSAGNNMEEIISALFTKYLGFNYINLTDNFYEMGGDSIAAIKIVNELNELLNINLKDVDILKNPSVLQLAQWLKQSDAARQSSAYSIMKQPVKPFYPLSSDQSRIFIMSQYNPGLTMYNKPLAVIVEGAMNRVKWQLALDKVIQRHESLRTSFEVINGEPVQIVHEDVTLTLDFHPSVIDESRLEDLLKQFTQPFDWRKAPLARGLLVPFTNGKYALVFDIHHLISDGTSLLIFFKELIHYYETDQELEQPSIQYKDYAVWQTERKEPQEQERLQRFWLSKCASPMPQLNLPTDFERPSSKIYEGAQISLRVEPKLTAEIYRMARLTESTIYVVLLATYHLLLGKQSGQEDIILGSVSQGRPMKETDPVIGMFVHTIIMRNRSSNDITFNEFIQHVKANTLQSFEHQDYPFEDLVASLQIQRDRSRNPLFDAAFILHNMYTSLVSPNSLRVVNHPYHHGISLVDIALEVHETEDGLVFNWEYSTSLFRKDTIKALGEEYLEILSQLLANPDITLGEHACLCKSMTMIEDVEFLF